jgi:hypothetical protein
LPHAKKLDQIYGHQAINSFIPSQRALLAKTSLPYIKILALGSFIAHERVYIFTKQKSPSQREREIQSGADAALNSGLLCKLTLCAIQKADYKTPKKERTIENASGVPSQHPLAAPHPSVRKKRTGRTHND